MERKSPIRQLSLAIPDAEASQFHPTSVEGGPGSPPVRSRRSVSLIRQALYLDQEDAYSAGEVGLLARALVQAALDLRVLRALRSPFESTSTFGSHGGSIGCASRVDRDLTMLLDARRRVPFDGWANTRDNFAGWLPSLIDDAGFEVAALRQAA